MRLFSTLKYCNSTVSSPVDWLRYGIEYSRVQGRYRGVEPSGAEMMDIRAEG